MTKNKYLKSPLNYVGGKHKLLPQIIPLFPNKINMFIDLMGGGFNVGANVEANRVICNDIESNIISLLKYFKHNSYESIVNDIESLIVKYELSDTYRLGYEHYGCESSSGVASVNKDGYTRLRQDYNNGDRSDIMFYTMLIFAFNNQIRFNSKNEFNMPVNKRDFNKSIRSNLEKFVNRLHEINATFTDYDFRKIKLDKLSNEDLIYCDPPYLITCASYNEQDGWNQTLEKELLSMLDSANEKGVKFALSNVLRDGDKSNDILIEWSKKYKIHNLNHNYGNANYQKKNKASNETEEVLIVNY